MNNPLPELDIDLLLELAQRRLHDKLNHGLHLGHKYVEKELPGATTQNKNYAWCENCESWSWGVGLTCKVEFERALQNEINYLKDGRV